MGGVQSGEGGVVVVVVEGKGMVTQV
jgi:hypothetical protein